MVAVSLGEGFSNSFRDLTVDCIVEGGQTMNPSTDDILQAINSVNAKCVFVFPNNGNVVMAAQQAAELSENGSVRAACAIESFTMEGPTTNGRTEETDLGGDQPGESGT